MAYFINHLRLVGGGRVSTGFYAEILSLRILTDHLGAYRRRAPTTGRL